jgi:dsRNA-specific ribonuclease
MGEGDAKQEIENEPSVKEDLFESIIGAIYIDSRGDMKRVISVVKKMLDMSEYEKTGRVIQSHKNALQEFCADKRRRLPAPVYRTLSESGPEHKKIYERGCYIGDKLYGRGIGKNLKLADAAAAEAALIALKAEYLNEPQDTIGTALTLLKEIAEKNKKPSPEYHDLGETAHSTEVRREYEVECRFMGLTARGTASDKRTAKAMAAEKILRLIKRKR